MSARRERGVAAITAVLIVAVAASAATYMLAQQSAMLDQSALLVSRAQADFYAQAGLDWARGVLAADAQRNREVDSLDEGWAQPIVGLPVDRAVVAGRIEDEQGKFNLNNLAQKKEGDIRILRRLLESAGLSPDLASAVVDWVDGDDALSDGSGAENAYYLSRPRPYRAANQPMAQVDELHRVRGFDAAAVAKLRPHVTALPGPTPVNINTASEAVIAAILPELPRAELGKLLEERRTRPFTSRHAITQRYSKISAATANNDLDVKSAFFSVRVEVSQDGVELADEALVQRGQGLRSAVLWRRSLY